MMSSDRDTRGEGREKAVKGEGRRLTTRTVMICEWSVGTTKDTRAMSVVANWPANWPRSWTVWPCSAVRQAALRHLLRFGYYWGLFFPTRDNRACRIVIRVGVLLRLSPHTARQRVAYHPAPGSSSTRSQLILPHLSSKPSLLSLPSGRCPVLNRRWWGWQSTKTMTGWNGGESTV
jgi:hypothetical protein